MVLRCGRATRFIHPPKPTHCSKTRQGEICSHREWKKFFPRMHCLGGCVLYFLRSLAIVVPALLRCSGLPLKLLGPRSEFSSSKPSTLSDNGRDTASGVSKLEKGKFKLLRRILGTNSPHESLTAWATYRCRPREGEYRRELPKAGDSSAELWKASSLTAEFQPHLSSGEKDEQHDR